MTERRLIYYLWLAGSVLFLISLVYGICLDIPFAHHDSLRYFGRYFLPPSADLTDPYYPFSWVQGRPVASELENFIFRHAKDFAGLGMARLACAILAGVLAFSITLILIRVPLDPRIAVLLGTWLAVLPGLQNGVFMLWPHYLLGACCAVWAYGAWMSRRSVLFRTAGAGALLLFALFCYTVTAFLFVALLAVPLLWNAPAGWKKIYKDTVGGMGLLVACSVVYFVLVKLVLTHRFPEALAGTHAVRQLAPSVLHLPQKLLCLLTDGALFVFNPFSPPGGVVGGYAVLFLILFALTKDTAWDWVLRWRRMLVWCLLGLASVMVWLISPMDTLLYRVFYPAMALCAISLVWAVAQVGQRLGGTPALMRMAVGVMLGVGILAARQTLTLNVWNANSEMTFMRSQLARVTVQEVNRIHVIEPVPSSFAFNGRPLVDDYVNMNSAFYGFDLAYLVKMGLWGQVPSGRPLWHCQEAQAVCVQKAPTGILLLTHSRPGEPVLASAKMVLVDLNDMVRATLAFREAGRR